MSFSRYIYVPFDESMQLIESAPISKRYKLYRDIYDTNNPEKLIPVENPIIPKIIHQIWLGPYKMPKDLAEYSKKWQELHSGWGYKLWTDEDVAKMQFPDRDLFEKASTYQEKAEILKYNILKQHGGLYVDVDYKPIRMFDYLHYTYDFYAGILPPLKDTNDVIVSTSIMGSSPNNMLINNTLSEIRKVWDSSEKEFIKKHQTNKMESISILEEIRIRKPFNKILEDKITFAGRAIILPPTYLNIVVRNQLIDPYLEAININKRNSYFHIIHRETLAAERHDGTRIIQNLSGIKIKETFFRRNFKKVRSLFYDIYDKFND